MFLEKDGEELRENRCVITSEKSFLERFADSGFKTKWSGFWIPPFKFMDYYAYKVNGNWLSHENVDNFTIQPRMGLWDHETSGLSVREYVFLLKNSFVSVLELKNTSDDKKAVSMCMEPAMDFRPNNEDISNAKYDVDFSEPRASVKITDRNSDLSGMIGKAKSGKGKVEWEEEDRYREHYPQERQMCYIPGTYRIKMEMNPGESVQVPFVFTFSKEGDPREEFDKLMSSWDDFLIQKTEETSQVIQGEIETPNEKLNEAFKWSKLSLNDLIFSYDKDYLFAGLPWFQSEWGRDSLWSLLGFLDMGDFDFVRDQLRTLFENKEKRIPNKISPEGDSVYNGADTNPLFLIVADRYEKFTGKKLFKGEDLDVRDAFESLDIKGKKASHSPEETWMDTLERGSSSLDVQSLWLEAAKVYNHRVYQDLEEGLAKFWNEDKEFMYDFFDGEVPIDAKTINCAVPLMFGQIEESKAINLLEVIGGEFTTQQGVRTRSCLEEDYSPELYHKGSVWYLTTLWSACANLKYERIKEGLSLLEKTAEDIYRHQLGGISECVNAENGELLGCTNQAWSEALFIHAVDTYLFGIRPNLKEKKLSIDPNLPEDWERATRTQKNIGSNTFDLKIERDEDKFRVAINFEEEPKIRLEVPDKYEAKVNSKRIDKARLQKQNVVEIKEKR